MEMLSEESESIILKKYVVEAKEAFLAFHVVTQIVLV